MARRNQLIMTGSVAWTLNEDVVKNMDVAVPDIGSGESGAYLLTVKNASAVVSLTVDVRNVLPDMDSDSTDETSALTSFTVGVGATRSVLLQGFPLGLKGNLLFTKSAATAAAFSAYAGLRRA